MANATWRFSDSAEKAMQDAATIAQKYHHTLVWPVHLALALLGPLPGNSPFDSLPQSHFLKLIALAHGDLQIFQNALIQTIVGLPSNKLPPKHVIRSGDLERVLSQANSCRITQNETLVAIEHLISGILRDGDVQAALQVAYTPRSKINSIHIAIDESENRISKLTAKRMVDPVIGRDEEIRRLITVLSRRKNNNAILVGESGIGKTSIINGLVQCIVKGDVPTHLMGCKMLFLNGCALLAGADFQDESFEKPIREVLNATHDHEAMTSIFLDDLHLLLGNPNGVSSEDDRVHFLRSLIFKKELHHCIATTTPTDYQTLTEKSPAFLSKFVMIPVEQPNIRETLSILRGLKHRYETSHGFAIADSALFETAALAAEYFPSQSLPRSAIELVNKTTAIIATTRDSGLEELKRMEKEKSQLVTKITYLELRMNNPCSYIEKARTELSGLEKMIKSLSESHDILLSIRRDLHQQTARLEEFRSIHAKGELEGNVPGAADTLHDLILETQAHIDKAKLREEEAVSDVSKHMKDPSTKLFFANRVGPAQVRQIVRELTGRRPIPGLASLMTGDPALEWKGKEKSALKTLPRDDGEKIPSTCGPSSVILANMAHESLNSATPMDEPQETQRLSEITESSRKEVAGEAPIGQIQAAPEREEEKGNEHELKDNLPADQGTDIPSNISEVGEISKFGLEVSSTPISPGLGDCEASKENPAGKTKSRSIWRKVKISKLFKSK